MKKVIVVAALAALAALAATPALAADMLVKKAPPAPPAPAWSWTGFYVGANAGGGWASTNWFEDVSESGSGGAAPPGFEDASVHASGLLGGGQIGYDWQNGWTIFGIQTDADAAGLRGASSCFPQITGLVFGGVTIAPQSCSTKINAVGTVTGRLGAAFDRSLYYVLGGFAWEHEQLDDFCPNCLVPVVGVGLPTNSEFSGTRYGATVGAGIEYALGAKWSIFLQYNYMAFGKRALVFFTDAAEPPFTEIIREDIQVMKVGLNYRFH